MTSPSAQKTAETIQKRMSPATRPAKRFEMMMDRRGAKHFLPWRIFFEITWMMTENDSTTRMIAKMAR